MPTPKQQVAMQEFIKGIKKGEVLPMETVMRRAGFSIETSKKPKVLTESKGWQELLDKYFPDEKITKILNDLLESKDKRVKLQALETLLKLKDKFPTGKLRAGAFEEREQVVMETEEIVFKKTKPVKRLAENYD